MNSVLIRDLTVTRGCTERLRVRYLNRTTKTPISLTGFVARLELFSLTSTTPTISLSTENSGITIDTANGIIECVFAQNQTATLREGQAVYRYNLKIKAPVSGEITALLSGQVTVLPTLTTFP